MMFGELPIFCLESNYGSIKHWARLVDNAKNLGVTRLVWLWFRNGVMMPSLYQWLPEFNAAWDWEHGIGKRKA